MDDVAPTPAELEKARGVRRMKAIATGFLLLATAVFAVARWLEARGAGPWSGYVQAAAEAGMVGAMADWFAVTALFRHPLGLRIPHTAIIPNRKDALGDSLGEFVGENFLSAEVVRKRLASLDVARRLGHWLADPRHAERVTEELSALARAALTILRDDDVQSVFGQALTRRMSARQVAQPIGALLGRVVEDGGHHGLIDLVVDKAHDWLVDNREAVLRVVAEESPGWSPRFLDRTVANKVHRELVRFAAAVRDDPDHSARRAVDEFLADTAEDMQHDPAMIAQIEGLRDRTLAHPQIQELIASTWAAARSMLVEATEDPNSELRARATKAVRVFGGRLADDPRLRNKVDRWLADGAAYLVTTYRTEITALITDTVRAWDPAETSRKIELHVGRDLQFIRINGTVVGALVGLVIYTLGRLAG
ncbi:DUF445 domain-containing protein [Yinghuangia seranimata]|uniref:DUF445 domain-containing protein n=1 Tax=Yinghuangia seranimata TaxID=408067 RepID=UPI00248B5F97|nr:DUF445 domain-containing protein [Yinghuangia seranimata]MDI2126090.1 DUF445 domain-containing protein [Yinghuangia seranimata]